MSKPDFEPISSPYPDRGGNLPLTTDTEKSFRSTQISIFSILQGRCRTPHSKIARRGSEFRWSGDLTGHLNATKRGLRAEMMENNEKQRQALLDDLNHASRLPDISTFK